MVKMVKMKGGSTEEAIVIGIFLLIVIGGVSWLIWWIINKCKKVTDTCANDDDCCEYLKCVGTKCCSPSTKVCSNDNECCGSCVNSDEYLIMNFDAGS